MIQIYCGDGKGKTTASMGLAVRHAGRGNRVIIAQFMKSADSGERLVLPGIPGITMLDIPETMKFAFAMSDGEKQTETQRQTALFEAAAARAMAGECTLLVLDEMCSAVSLGMVPLTLVTDFLDGKPENLEVVMTGRDPEQALQDRADYITEMRKVKHPFDKGCPSRIGVEW